MRTHTVVLAVVLAGFAADAEAQVVDSADVFRGPEGCRVAVRVLTAGHPHRDWDRAMWRIEQCPEQGGEVLAGVWASPPADEDALQRLVAPGEDPRFSSVRRSMHTVTFEGIRPPVPETPRRVVDALRSMAASAGDEHVRWAAAALHHGLGRRLDSG